MHRPALDGLRTVAVYLVVLFHAGVELAAGGFVGVDLFFVLSGFLVVNVLLTELDVHGRVRLWRFYSRRVRRLLPAASVTIVGTIVLMLVVANQVDRLDLVGDARAASLWYANWHFLAESSSYFAEGDLASPFLHFWSLSIEEQFYLVFPLILVAAWGRGGRRIVMVLGCLTAVGLLAQFWTARTNPDGAYYATHARGYQLLAGATVGAWVRLHGVPGRLVRWGSWTAVMGVVGLVVVSTPAVPLEPSTRGMVATVVAVAAVLGLEGARHGPVAMALSTGPMTWLGRISYGTYLWHWPLLVAAQRVFELDIVSSIAVSGIGGTVLAALSHRLLEERIRRSPHLDLRPRLVVTTGVVAAVGIGLWAAPSGLESSRRPVALLAGDDGERVSSEDLGPVPAGLDLAAVRADRAMGPDCYGDAPDACVVVDGDGLAVHLTGDSHAGMMLPAFEMLARANEWRLSVTTADACPWIPGLFAGQPGNAQAANCRDRRDAAYDEIIPALAPDVVVAMMAPRGEDHDGKGVFSDQAGVESTDPPTLLRSLTPAGVQRLGALAPRVVILETVPRTDEDMLACLSGAQSLSECVFEAPPAPGAEDDRQLRAAAQDVDNVEPLDIDMLACPRLPLCTPLEQGHPVRRDAHHLSVPYVRSVAGALAERLASTVAFDRVQLPPAEVGS